MNESILNDLIKEISNINDEDIKRHLDEILVVTRLPGFPYEKFIQILHCTVQRSEYDAPERCSPDNIKYYTMKQFVSPIYEALCELIGNEAAKYKPNKYKSLNCGKRVSRIIDDFSNPYLYADYTHYIRCFHELLGSEWITPEIKTWDMLMHKIMKRQCDIMFWSLERMKYDMRELVKYVVNSEYRTAPVVCVECGVHTDYTLTPNGVVCNKCGKKPVFVVPIELDRKDDEYINSIADYLTMYVISKYEHMLADIFTRIESFLYDVDEEI